MKQQKFDRFDKTKTLSEIQLHRNPTVWECGRKFDFELNDYVEVNGKPKFRKEDK